MQWLKDKIYTTFRAQMLKLNTLLMADIMKLVRKYDPVSQSKYFILFFVAVLPFFGISTSASNAHEEQLVMGAGPSTAVVSLFFRHFSLLPAVRNHKFEVEQRSIKHAGGIKASGKYLFGRTGRPLNKSEKQQGKHDLFLARIPLSFVVGKGAGVSNITLDQLNAIFNRSITNWSELGGADATIMLTGREQTEAAFSVIKHDHPYFNNVEFDHVFFRDHQMVNFIKSSNGVHAIGFGARHNFEDEYILQVDGFQSGVSLGLVYDSKNKDHPVVKTAIEFASSEKWRNRVIESGLLQPD